MRRRARAGGGAMLVALGGLPAAAVAGPYTGLVVFGDSLSDIGNVQTTTTAPGAAALGVPPTPGPYYYQGRFSNGPNYADDLAAGLGLGPLLPSTGGGTDYAYGDAMTTGTPFPESLFVEDTDTQVEEYLSAHTPTASTLFDVFIGANDLRTQAAAGTPDPAPVAANVASDMTKLYNAGGRQFLVPNLPLLGELPESNGDPTTAAEADALTVAYNTDLAADLDQLQATEPGIVLHQLDTAALFATLVADRFAYGLNDVTDPAAPGLEPDATRYDTSLEVPEPSKYLFWDTVHPTAAGHALLGEAALAAVVPEPATLSLLAAGMCLTLGRRRRH